MAHGPAHASITELIQPAINFAIFAFIVGRFLRAPMVEYFRSRAERIGEALAAGARARTEATALRAQIAQDIAQLPMLRQHLQAELRTVAERERDKALELAKKAAERIRADARLVAEQEFMLARAALQNEVAGEGAKRATALLQNTIRPEDQAGFVREFINSAGATS